MKVFYSISRLSVAKCIFYTLLLAFLIPASILVAAETKPEKFVIAISMDGLRPDAVTKQGKKVLPNFYRMREEGAFTDNARTNVTITVTLPNHTSMFTSRFDSGAEGHHMTFNDDTDLLLHQINKGKYIDSMFGVAHDNGLGTAMFVSKSKFDFFKNSWDDKNGAVDKTGPDNGKNKIDIFFQTPNQIAMIEQFIVNMKKNYYQLSFVHFRGPDTAGHLKGWMKPEYMQAVQEVDEQLGHIFALVNSDPRLKGNTYIILTADHGGTNRNHQKQDVREHFTIPFYAWGPGVPAGKDLYELNTATRANPGQKQIPMDADKQSIRNGDVGNLALTLLGLETIPGSTINTKKNLLKITK